MQYLGIFLVSLLGFSIKELALRAITAVGFGLVTTYGIYSLFDQLQLRFQLSLTGLPADILAMLGLMQVDNCFTIILSSAASKQVLNGWSRLTNSRTGGAWKSPGTGGNLGA